VIRIRIATVVMLLAAGTLARADGGQGPRDLWIAVLVDELLVPVGALLDGEWRVDVSAGHDANARGVLTERVGKRPIVWPPAGRALPGTWRAHVGGRRKVARVAEPIEEHQEWGHFGVRTDLWLPRARPGDPTRIHGVAVAGDVTVRRFRPLAEGPRLQALMGVLDAPATLAARQALRLARAEAAADSPWKAVAEDTVVGGSFHVEDSRAVDLRDGSTLFYLETSKVPVDGCEVHVRATFGAPRGGDIRVTAVEGLAGCDNYVNLSPLAVVERGGVVCWVSEERSEDGSIFVLRAPDIVPTGKSRCAIK
jgi:hypothetical protein